MQTAFTFVLFCVKCHLFVRQGLVRIVELAIVTGVDGCAKNCSTVRIDVFCI